jgi:anti-sigma factor RsiW
MIDHRSTWHIGHEALYDYLDRSLDAQATAEVELHVRGCPECATRLREARALFGRLADLETPALQVDLAPQVLLSLVTARRSAVRWRWVLAGQAIVAVCTLVVLGAHVEDWIMQALRDPALQAVRQSGIQLLAEFSVWITPILDLIPSLPTRLAPMRLPLPQLDGPAAGWGLLACSAVVLGLMGNALLLRAPRVAVPSAEHGKRPSDEERGRA